MPCGHDHRPIAIAAGRAWCCRRGCAGASRRRRSRRCTRTRWRARSRRCATALAEPATSPRPSLKAVRTVVARLRGDRPALSRRAATATTRCGSAGRLSLDAFARFGERARQGRGDAPAARARVASIRRSKLAKQVPAQLAARRAAARPRRRRTDTPGRSASPRRSQRPAPAHDARSRRAASRDDQGHPPRGAARRRPRSPSSSTAKCAFHDERLGEPDRACSSICRRRSAAPALVDRTIRFDGDADVVRQVRIGRHPNNTTRVVLDVGGRLELQRLPAVQPVPAGDRLRQETRRRHGGAAATATLGRSWRRAGRLSPRLPAPLRRLARLQASRAPTHASASSAAGAAAASALAARVDARRRGRRHRPPATDGARPCRHDGAGTTRRCRSHYRTPVPRRRRRHRSDATDAAADERRRRLLDGASARARRLAHRHRSRATAATIRARRARA